MHSMRQRKISHKHEANPIVSRESKLKWERKKTVNINSQIKCLRRFDFV